MMPVHDQSTHSHRVGVHDTLDFANTGGSIGPDALADDDRALAWLVDRGLIHRDNPRLAASADPSGRARQLRAALRALFAATTERRPPGAAALAEINRALRAVAPIELAAGPDGCTVGHRHLGDPVDDALGRLAQVVLQAVIDGEIARLRLCANPSCRAAFHDNSRAGTRRWCDMTTCGNRAKAGRHRARARAAVVPGLGKASRADLPLKEEGLPETGSPS